MDQNMAAKTAQPGPPFVLAIVLLVVAIPLVIGGAQLVLLGGSAYYILAGVLALATAWLAWRRNALAVTVYAVLLMLTTVWAFAETGWDGWALAPRLIAPFVLGAWFLLPHMRRVLPRGDHRLQRGGWFVAAVALAVALGMAWHTLAVDDPVDPVLRAGRIAAASGIAIGEVGASAPGEWRNYGGAAGGSRYSPLGQITGANVDRLRVAWTFDTGKGPVGTKPAMEATPLIVGDTLYSCTSYNDVIALDAETGRQKWRSPTNPVISGPYGSCRGVAYYDAGTKVADCQQRIITATVDARLIGFDARTGRRCPSFGTDGTTDLRKGLSAAPAGYYFVSSAPTIVRGKIVIGGWVTDNQSVNEPSGVIRGYDAVTGRFSWAFDVGRPDDHGEPGPGKTYTPGTPNSWAPMSADEDLGLVYAPTGNSAPDSYGAQRRPFDERFSTSVVALDAETGRLRWSFQTLHHDLWDHDVPSQPVLIDLPLTGTVRHALIQPTKQGEIFILDRTTGQPIFPVREEARSVKGAVPLERVSSTQPASFALPSFRGPDLIERRAWGITPIDQLYCRILFKKMLYDGPETPPSLQGTIVQPGSLGAINWGSVSIDVRSGVMLVNSNLFNGTFKLLPRVEANRLGIKPVGPAGQSSHSAGDVAMAETPYGGQQGLFWSPLIVPCMQPPYGMLSAVDLKTGKLIWHRPFGTARNAGPLTIPSGLPLELGAPNMGGSVATASGLVFIAASQDAYMRAFDIRTGEERWRAPLPAGGQATPAIYRSPHSGREFVVISAGGSATMLSPVGTRIVAFALPK